MSITQYDIFTREPESMTVDQLNHVVKELREELSQRQLKIQKLQDLKGPVVFASKAERRRVLTLFMDNNEMERLISERDELHRRVEVLKVTSHTCPSGHKIDSADCKICEAEDE